MEIKLTMDSYERVMLRAIISNTATSYVCWNELDYLHANLNKFLSHQFINRHLTCDIAGGTHNGPKGMTTVTRTYTFKNRKDALAGYELITAQITAMRLCGGLSEVEVKLL